MVWPPPRIVLRIKWDNSLCESTTDYQWCLRLRWTILLVSAMTILTNFGNWGNYVKLVMIEHELKTPIEASNKTGTGVFLNQICKEVMVKVNGHNYVAGEILRKELTWGPIPILFLINFHLLMGKKMTKTKRRTDFHQPHMHFLKCRQLRRVSSS